jgi:phage FluMu protein Com
MLATITCPECNTVGRFSVLEHTYEGPYKCWKCRQLFFIQIEGEEVKTCRLLGEEEFEKLQQLEKLKRKFKKDEDD